MTTKTAKKTTPTPAQAIASLLTDLNARFPERRDVIEGLVLALLAGEHAFLLGPPGTAKSALARALADAFSGTYFEWLLSKFSTPEELFGPVSLRALEQDRFARVVTGKLPEAEIAFLDECFKANSAILNSLLTIVNERVYHNDGKPQPCPLVSVIGASNELPEAKELEALFDRFLVRFDVRYLDRHDSLRAMLRAPEPKSSVRLSMAELRAAQAEVAAVAVTDDTVDALIAIRDTCRAEGIVPSDRRWKKSIKLAQARAWLDGQTETSPEDLGVLADSLWREPKERAKVARLVGQIADPATAKAVEIIDSARETSVKVQGLARGDRGEYVKAASNAIAEFRTMTTALDSLAKGGGRRAGRVIADAKQEVEAMRAEVARVVSAGLGLR